MKILFCTNIPSPYRIDFFNVLGTHCDLTVCYERHSASDRDAKWVGSSAKTYNEVYLPLKPFRSDASRGSALRKFLATHSFDHLILTNYVSPSCMEAIAYCRIKKIPYWIEYDGGFNKSDPVLRRILKKLLLKQAVGHITTCEEHIEYLKKLGIASNKIFKYPFTSISDLDIEKSKEKTRNGKEYYRRKLQLTENRIIVSVGQFIYRKGFDLLIEAAKKLCDTGVYIIGGEPTEEYLSQADGYGNIHFVGFKTKEELSEYYCAADLMVFLTREDIWGLVVNEAMAYGLPVITTDRCIAGLELVKNGENGFIVPADTYKEAIKVIRHCFDSSCLDAMSDRCLETAVEYTIEKMALRHLEILDSKSPYSC